MYTLFSLVGTGFEPTQTKNLMACDAFAEPLLTRAFEDYKNYKDLPIQWTIYYDYEFVNRQCCVRVHPTFDLNQGIAQDTYELLSKRYYFDRCTEFKPDGSLGEP